MSQEEGKKILLNLLKVRSGHKQDVFKNTKTQFGIFKKVLAEFVASLDKELDASKIRLRLEDKGDSEAHLYIGSDVLVFHMHSNVFKLPNNDYASQTSYIQNNPLNAYCGIIRVYDFLADSYEFNRTHDIGYMICRILINSENHFKVEGKGQLGYIYQNFMHQVLSKEIMHEMLLRIAIYAIDFDLLTPPYQTVSQVSLSELQELSSNSKQKTGKRLGFQFSSKSNIV